MLCIVYVPSLQYRNLCKISCTVHNRYIRRCAYIVYNIMCHRYIYYVQYVRTCAAADASYNVRFGCPFNGCAIYTKKKKKIDNNITITILCLTSCASSLSVLYFILTMFFYIYFFNFFSRMTLVMGDKTEKTTAAVRAAWWIFAFSVSIILLYTKHDISLYRVLYCIRLNVFF